MRQVVSIFTVFIFVLINIEICINHVVRVQYKCMYYCIFMVICFSLMVIQLVNGTEQSVTTAVFTSFRRATEGEHG